MVLGLYDPRLRRFLEVDPIEGGSANDYVKADPVNGYDLDGKKLCLDRSNKCSQSVVSQPKKAPDLRKEEYARTVGRANVMTLDEDLAHGYEMNARFQRDGGTFKLVPDRTHVRLNPNLGCNLLTVGGLAVNFIPGEGKAAARVIKVAATAMAAGSVVKCMKTM